MEWKHINTLIPSETFAIKLSLYSNNFKLASSNDYRTINNGSYYRFFLQTYAWQSTTNIILNEIHAKIVKTAPDISTAINKDDNFIMLFFGQDKNKLFMRQNRIIIIIFTQLFITNIFQFVSGFNSYWIDISNINDWY